MSITTKVIDHSITVVADFPAVRVATTRTERGYDHGFEVDRVKAHLVWWGSGSDDEPAGWHVSVEAKGWPLTRSGARDKRIKQREWVVDADFPAIIHEAAKAAYEEALSRSQINPRDVLGDDGQPGTPLTLNI